MLLTHLAECIVEGPLLGGLPPQLSVGGEALAGEVQWIEHQPANQRVTDWFDSQLGHMPGCRLGPQ